MNFPSSNWDTEFQPKSYLEGVQAQQDINANRQLGDLTIATKKQEMETENALAPFKVQEAQYQSNESGRKDVLSQQDYENNLVADVARRAKAVDPQQAPQVWDQGMQALADKGIGLAEQYVGHYRPDLADHVYSTFGGETAGGRKGGAGGEAEAVPGFDSEAFTRSIATVPLPLLQKSLGNLNRAIQGFNNVKDAASWQAELQALQESGIPVAQFLPNTDWTPMNYAAAHRLIQGMTARRDLIADRVAEMGVGLPGETPKPMYEPSYQFLGTDDQGRAITMDTRTGQANVGSQMRINPKPSVAMGTFNLKYQAAINQGYTKQQALEFANGKRSMGPAQIQIEALKIANQQLYDETNAGTPPANPDQWVRNRTAQIVQELSTAGAPSTSAPAGNGGARPAARMSQADKQTSIANARAALKAHPDKRGVIIQRLKAAGIPTNGL